MIVKMSPVMMMVINKDDPGNSTAVLIVEKKFAGQFNLIEDTGVQVQCKAVQSSARPSTHCAVSSVHCPVQLTVQF